MGGRGGSSVQSRKMHPEYARAVESAKVKIKAEEKEAKARTQRIVNSIKARNEGIKNMLNRMLNGKRKFKNLQGLHNKGNLKNLTKPMQKAKKYTNQSQKILEKNRRIKWAEEVEVQ